MTVNIKKDFGSARSRKPDLTNLVYGKIPPQVPQVEEAVLGACLNERAALPTAIPILQTPDVFYVDAHQKIFDAMLKTQTAGYPVDLLTVVEFLSKSGDLDIVGGAHYLSTLSANVVSGAHVDAHSKIIVEKFLQREIIRICGRAIGEGYEDSTDPFDLLANIETELHQVTRLMTGSNTIHIAEAGKKAIEKVDRIRNGEIAQGGIESGIRSIDEVTGGWQDTDLIVIAARPAVGKTAFVLNAMYNSNVPCLFFSLEMGAEQIYRRLAANTANIPLDFINSPHRMTPDVLRRWHEEHARLSQSNLYINDKAGMNITEMRAVIADFVRKKSIRMVAIDYLQLAHATASNREQEISKISRELKCIAKDFSIPVIALSQLNRGVENRASNKPTLSDLRESGAIEQDADIVAFLYGSNDESLKGVRNFDIAKHRNGVTRDMLLKFQGEYQRFTDNEPEPFSGTFIPDRPGAGIYRNQSLPYKD